MAYERTVNFMALVWIVLIIAGAIGWVWNIIKLFSLFSADLTAELFIRIVGVFIPFIGAIAGYF